MKPVEALMLAITASRDIDTNYEALLDTPFEHIFEKEWDFTAILETEPQLFCWS